MSTQVMERMAMPGPSQASALGRLQKRALNSLDRYQAHELSRNVVRDILKAELPCGYKIASKELYSAKIGERAVARAVARLVDEAVAMESVLAPGALQRLIDEEVERQRGQLLLSIDGEPSNLQAGRIADPSPSVEEIAEEADFQRWAEPQIQLSSYERNFAGLFDMHLSNKLSKGQMEVALGMPYHRIEMVMAYIDDKIDKQMRLLRKQYDKDII